jgi:hypothetical protein
MTLRLGKRKRRWWACSISTIKAKSKAGSPPQNDDEELPFFGFETERAGASAGAGLSKATLRGASPKTDARFACSVRTYPRTNRLRPRSVFRVAGGAIGKRDSWPARIGARLGWGCCGVILELFLIKIATATVSGTNGSLFHPHRALDFVRGDGRQKWETAGLWVCFAADCSSTSTPRRCQPPRPGSTISQYEAERRMQTG